MDNRTITGAEFIDFYRNGWPGKPGEVWHEDSEIAIEDDHGNLLIRPGQILRLDDLGHLRFGMGGGAVPFADAFLKWKAGNRASATYVTCRIPAENAERLREVILSLGGEEIVGRKEPD